MEKTLPITPLGNRVVIKRDEAQKESAGGILLPDSHKDRPKTGLIVCANASYVDGKGNVRDMPVKNDDRVIFPAYSGVEIEVDGETFLLLNSDEIFAILD